MKNLVRFSIVLVSLLVALTGCELFNAVNLAWSIDGVFQSGFFTHVTYTVQNFGKVDLTGVNLEIGVDVSGTRVYPYSAWTPDFSISQNQILHGSLDVYTAGYTPFGATVISVDMDNPKD